MMTKRNSLGVKGILIFILLVCVLLSISNQPAKAFLQYPGPETATATIKTPTQVLPTQAGSPSPSPSVQATLASTATTTLVPLPAITLIFPVLTDTPTPTETPTGQTPGNPGDDTNGRTAELSPRTRVLAIVIIVLWLVLIGFAIIFIRQVR
jgi:hypothetical protein